MLKKILSLALALILALGMLSFPAYAAVETPSSWAVADVNKAIEANLVPQALQSEYTQAVTRAEFCALAAALYESLKGPVEGRLTFTDTNDVNVEKMASLGVVNGVGEGKFDPGAKLNREQAATMLSRLSDTIGKPFAKTEATYSDNDRISSWALEAAGRMTTAGVISGTGNNTFSPKGDCTREQCIIMILRTYDAEPWDFFNKQAEAFVEAMANDDFVAAAAMFDADMKQAVPIPVLKNDLWDVIVGQAGEYISVFKTENLMIDEYCLCFIVTKHENSGVMLQIAFSENGLVAGLSLGGFPSVSGLETVQREGFTDYPVTIGEGTDYPLNGILSMPDDPAGKVPAVVLVHGSGSSDMDETVFMNKPFRDIADHLASNGIAVIRYDKRPFVHGAAMIQRLGGSLTVFEETIEDAILAAEILKSDPRIDANKVFIIGHSLGGMLAPRIHAEGGNFAGIISLAGSPRSLFDIMYDQQMAYIEEMPESIDKELALFGMENYYEEIEFFRGLSDDDAKNVPLPGNVSAYYYLEMEKHPVPELIKNIKAPFLILQGSKDFQVYADKDYVLWRELLAGRSNAAFKLYEGLNHLFMTSTGKSIAEYQEEYQIPNHIDAQVLKDIAEWIKSN